MEFPESVLVSVRRAGSSENSVGVPSGLTERGCLPRDWKGPWRRVGSEERLGSGLEGTRVHPRRPQLCREKPLPEAVQSPVCGCLAGVSLLREQEKRQHEEFLQELGKLLNTQKAALKQEQEANALAAQEQERLRQELDR